MDSRTPGLAVLAIGVVLVAASQIIELMTGDDLGNPVRLVLTIGGALLTIAGAVMALRAPRSA